mmetsp:Transcript_17847/g.29223  ORF Transcript_17847/g.29223 Transcript_17847/m.29223 type:complete len:81 (+) Transcript_17847:1267-1509(+)
MDCDLLVVVIARVVALSQVKKYHSLADSRSGGSLAGASALDEVAADIVVAPAAFAGPENADVEPFVAAVGKGNEEEGAAS